MDGMLFLGFLASLIIIALISATKFSLNLKPARVKFYCAFNSLYCKVSKANKVLITPFVNKFCVSAMMFWFEAFAALNAIVEPMYDAVGINF